MHLEDLAGWTSRLSAVSVGLKDPPLLVAVVASRRNQEPPKW